LPLNDSHVAPTFNNIKKDWNSLPDSIRSIEHFQTFDMKVKLYINNENAKK
jgi:hypothetical protein